MKKLFTQFGPLISVSIVPPQAVQAQLVAAGTPHTPIPVTALIDTGASMTAISPTVVKKANLQFTGYQPVQGAHGIKECNVFFGEVHFPWGKVRSVPLIECDLSNTMFECVIGRDTMENWILIYDGFSGVLTITE